MTFHECCNYFAITTFANRSSSGTHNITKFFIQYCFKTFAQYIIYIIIMLIKQFL